MLRRLFALLFAVWPVLFVFRYCWFDPYLLKTPVVFVAAVEALLKVAFVAGIQAI